MFRWLEGLLKGSTQPMLPVPDSHDGHEDPRIGPALELERRLYESAVSAVDQTFAKEGLVGTFLTSGAIVAFAASVQAFAQIAPSVGLRATWLCVGLFSLALILLGISCVKFTRLLRGWAVKDVSDAEEFVKDLEATSQAASLKLVVEYRQARENHVSLVKARLKNLFSAMRWLGGSMAVSFLAVLIAVGSVAIHKEPKRRNDPSQASTVIFGPTVIVQERPTPGPSYNKAMADKPTQDSPPIVFPKPGSGTTMIKGGGGDGSRK